MTTVQRDVIVFLLLLLLQSYSSHRHRDHVTVVMQHCFLSEAFQPITILLLKAQWRIWMVLKSENLLWGPCRDSWCSSHFQSHTVPVMTMNFRAQFIYKAYKHWFSSHHTVSSSSSGFDLHSSFTFMDADASELVPMFHVDDLLKEQLRRSSSKTWVSLCVVTLLAKKKTNKKNSAGASWMFSKLLVENVKLLESFSCLLWIKSCIDLLLS